MPLGRLSPGFTPFLGMPGQYGYFHTTPAGGHLALMDLMCTRPAYAAVLLGNRVSNLESFRPEVEALPPGHRGLLTVGNGSYNFESRSDNEVSIWGGEVSALGQEGSGFVTRFQQWSAVYVSLEIAKSAAEGHKSFYWIGSVPR
ncbi:hypothetical protein AVEN_165709-1 [Araneus ventricosus]|uniref:Uncharacterized protein n=1 Tax=Araneus ventricosus TaxID=182803 RepID=A0A4Y2C339_ARAVE|nr:hypothetical protein AVEN_165709-1 [Araneus ventricosus]